MVERLMVEGLADDDAVDAAAVFDHVRFVAL
jgi:hypothetical protein